MTVSPATRRRKARKSFVERTITGVGAAIEQTVYGEAYARQGGFLQRVDPRAKLGLFALALLVIGLVHDLALLASLWLALLGLGLAARLPFRVIAVRTMLGVPLFTGLIALPALFLIEGRPLFTIGPLGPVTLAVTDQAILSVATFLLRVSASVTLAALLVLTTRWADLLKALRVFRVPDVFIVVLGMTYRYIFLVLRLTENLFLGRASRTVGTTSPGEQRRWVGASMGTLMSRSLKLSNDVYAAMVARGFSGDVRTLTTFRMRDEDWLFVSLGVAVLGLAWLVDLSR
jgi:cobalt/nickel transport system permease protein